ncbi:ImmA/IrrE family metallo-endopeptidase [Staphylococcus petrasii]|uniref:ImmA/IrrE family metallo-endopeptidase n=1 Tax=Staphylococcus petrasii TaxID=1276936 RepID=UPI000CD2B714|nr:ImmA/IrrE family metallo-endopeptidase [Staphylococcus petrasii]PNZ81239.1 hypothetical protein CD127_08485 [Staphylococcus petrasii]TGA80330.1 ImmA/IrrE family metallo-endopeptidase [Staphylococcus petrasii]SUM59425.1 Domain of uncharacterised function (DUF955) [Staphylococcus petrasii]
MTATYKVNKNVLKWAVNQADIPSHKLNEEFKNLKTWLNEDSEIPVTQIEKLSKKTKIPFGYFFMETIPKESNKLADFRTIDNFELKKLSRNLIDVIKEMEAKQAWMRDYLIENGAKPLNFIGKFSLNNSPENVAENIFKILNLKPSWNTEFRSSYECYKFLRKTISEAGILVMQGSFVKNQTRRKLDLKEFRAFVLIDDYAPLIFINTSDSDTAKLFSIVHELVHIWLGKDEIYNFNYNLNEKNSEFNNINLERFCNKVTAKFLLPANKLIEQYEINPDVFELAKSFNVSPHFTAIRLKEVNLVNSYTFKEMLRNIEAEYKRIEDTNGKQEKTKLNVPYYTLKKSRIDRSFLSAVKNSVETGYANYTEAYTLAEAKGKTFKKLMEEI